MARLKDKWQQVLKLEGRELVVDVVHVTMTDGTMFGKVVSRDIHEIDVIRRPGARYWSPVFHKE